MSDSVRAWYSEFQDERFTELTLWQELRRRQVFRLAGLNITGAWVVIQVADRVKLRGYLTIDAECTHGTESLQ